MPPSASPPRAALSVNASHDNVRGVRVSNPEPFRWGRAAPRPHPVLAQGLECMKIPSRRFLDFQEQDDEPQDITFHISGSDIRELDLQFIADMLSATLSEQTASSLQGRVQFALEEDAQQFFDRGLPTLALRSYLRTFHYTLPAWPLVVSPDHPWIHLLAIGNAEIAGCCYNSVTRRARYRADAQSLEKFIASLRQGMESTARSLSIPEADWHPIADRVAAHVRKLDAPTTPAP